MSEYRIDKILEYEKHRGIFKPICAMLDQLSKTTPILHCGKQDIFKGLEHNPAAHQGNGRESETYPSWPLEDQLLLQPPS